jgi:hypothetical protein
MGLTSDKPKPLRMPPGPPSWTAFWFEGNQYFDWVRSPSDWERVKIAYDQPGCGGSLDLLDHAVRCNTSFHKHKFGLTMECDGKETLRDFFEAHGMQG